MVGHWRGLLVMRARAIMTRDSDPRGLIARLTMPPAFYKRVNETRFRQEWRMPKIIYECLALGWNGEGDWRRFLQLMLSGTGVRRYARIPQGSVVLTNHSVIDEDTTLARSQFIFQTDGVLDGVRLNAADSTYPGEWWSEEPETGIGNNYAVRWLSSGSFGALTSGSSAGDSWVTISAARTYTLERAVAQGVGTDIFQATFECGPEPSGPADDTSLLGLRVDII